MNNKEHLIINQAFYGEVNSAHGCLCSTIVDADLKAFLTGFSDRPSMLPAGMVMKPYYSAIVHGSYYIFTVTFPDNTTRRRGMVFTHALIIDIDDISSLNNPDILFSYFCKEIPENKTSLEKLAIPFSSLEAGEREDTFPSFVIESVSELTLGNFPIIVCGNSTLFLKLISFIWTGMPVPFRIKLSFTAGFTTVNLDASKTFIHFEQALKDSLKNQHFISTENEHQIKASSVVEKYILTPDSGKEFELFLNELNVELHSWQMLHYCAKAYEDYHKFDRLSNEALRQLIRQLARISPDKKDGEQLKKKVIGELKQRLDYGTDKNVKSLRNLPLAAFQDGEKSISISLDTFFISEFTNVQNFDDANISEAIIISYKTNHYSWWSDTIKDALSTIIRGGNSVNIENMWRILVYSEDSLTATLSFFPEDRKYEHLLIKFIPKNIPEDIAEIFAKSIEKRKWALLHAHLLQVYLSAEEAVKQQLFFERRFSLNNFEGADLLVKSLTDADILSLVMDTKDDFFVNEYISRSLAKPSLLVDLDVNIEVWLSIWKGVLEKTNDIEHGIWRPAQKIEELLNRFSLGKSVPIEIIGFIGNSKYADISGLQCRVALWSYLPTGIKEAFLEATANGIIKNISSSGLGSLIIEPELINYMASDKFMTSFLRQYRENINTVLEVYEHIPEVKDSFLADYIKYYPNRLNDVQSACLGDLILSKQFYQSARQVFEKAKSNSSFKVALTKCHSIANLGILDKFWWGGLLGETVSLSSVYVVLTETAIKLYSAGPEDNDIWKRAGGEVSKLHNHKTREENWRNAIGLLKNGGGGKDISTKSLIKEMLVDHHNNPELKQIQKYFK